jgi:phage head maturation protease
METDNTAVRTLLTPDSAELSVLAIQADSATISSYAVKFGGEDFMGSHFDPELTDFWDTWKGENPLPILFDHSLDEDVDLDQLGRTIRRGTDEVGLWFEAQLDRSQKYVDAVLRLISQKALGVSTGSVAHMLRHWPNGAFKSWPIAEISLTPTPAEPQLHAGVNRELGPKREARKGLEPADIKQLVGEKPIGWELAIKSRLDDMIANASQKPASDSEPTPDADTDAEAIAVRASIAHYRATNNL